jgi:hypothetical protein
MKGLSKFFTFTPSDRTIVASTMLSCITVLLFWILANVASELIEEFSFWLETGFALAQWLVLRRYIWNLGWWILASAWGWTIAFILIHFVGVGNWIVGMVPAGELEIGGVPVPLQVFWAKALLRLLEWSVIGVLQWLVLRRHIQHSSWWLLASPVGGAVKGALELVTRLVAGDLLGAIMGALAYGVVTGSVLVLLLQDHIKHRIERQMYLSSTFGGY